MVDGGIHISNREVKVDTILDRFAFRDALQDEPCRAGERSNGHKLPVGSGGTGFLAEQCSPEGRSALDIAYVEDDLHRENHRWFAQFIGVCSKTRRHNIRQPSCLTKCA